MALKPQDIVIVLKLVALEKQSWSYGKLAQSLHMSASEVHGGIKRAQKAQLIDQNLQVRKLALFNFLTEGLPYVFYPIITETKTRGFATSFSALEEDGLLAYDDEVFVWQSDEGNMMGKSILPLYSAVPKAIQKDEQLYRLLALTDACRIGGLRGYAVSRQLLDEALGLNMVIGAKV